jgi:hypothetical protein
VGKVLNAVGYAARAAVSTAAWVLSNVVYSSTVQSKASQGATEIANILYTGQAYSPYTADNAAHRAQFASHDAGRGMER